MDDRGRRIGRNEALFREVNERVKEVNVGFGILPDAEFVCECGDGDCADRVTMTLSDYEHVRADPIKFLVKEGHQIPDVESVVEQHSGWVVVQKELGSAARVAVETDPRS